MREFMWDEFLNLYENQHYKTLQYLYTLSQEQIDYCVEKIPFLPIHSPLQRRYVDLMQSIIGKTSSNIITKDFKRKHRAIMWFARVDR